MTFRPDLYSNNANSIPSCSDTEIIPSSNDARAARRKKAGRGRPRGAPQAELQFQMERNRAGLWQVLDARCACGGVFRDPAAAAQYIRQEIAVWPEPIVYVLVGSANKAKTAGR